ncbi:MAG: hypothetical protein ACRDJM_00215, partial [Actinomycetota bacterium]
DPNDRWDMSGWMQIGHIREYDTNVRSFVQWTKKGTNFSTPPEGFTDTDLGLVSPGSYRWYEVRYVPNCTPDHSCEQALIGVTPITSTWWSPFSYWEAPFVPDWAAETYWSESDIVGEAGTEEEFSQMRLQKWDNTWTSVGQMATPGATHPRAAIGGLLNDRFFMWCNELCEGSH